MLTCAVLTPLLLYPAAWAAWVVTCASGRGPWWGWPGAAVLGAAAGFVWGLIWRVLAVGKRANGALAAAGIAIAVTVTAGVGFWPHLGVWRGHYEARAVSCQSNLKLIGQALLRYADDHDDHLPPPVSSLDLAGVRYDRFEEARRQPYAFGMAVLGDGLLWPYTKNASIWHCPADHSFRDAWGRPRTDYLPEPGLSYRWNASIAGNRLDQIDGKSAVPLVFDRLPFHRGRRNVVFADGHAGAVARHDWRPVEGR